MSEEIVIAETYRGRSDLPTEQAPAEGNAMMTMLATAVQKGMPLETIQALRAMQKEYEADEARKAFMVDMAMFKKNIPPIYKDKENKQYNSRYASIGNLSTTLSEALAKFGFSVDWDYAQSEKTLTVTAILTHRLGHEKRVTASGPIDTSGAKNPLQQLKSTRTYLKIDTLEAVCGVASTDANRDDDGNASGFKMGDVMDESKLCDFLAAIETASNKAEVGKVYLIAIQEASHLKDQEAMDRLNAKKDAALAKLSEKK